MSRELFRFDSAASVADWSAIDDGVMGGVSRSQLRHEPAGYAVFEGHVSLERNGGFAAARSRPLPLGVQGAVGYLLDAPALDPTQVRQVGLMIADQQQGAFALAVRLISVERDGV